MLLVTGGAGSLAPEDRLLQATPESRVLQAWGAIILFRIPTQSPCPPVAVLKVSHRNNQLTGHFSTTRQLPRLSGQPRATLPTLQKQDILVDSEDSAHAVHLFLSEDLLGLGGVHLVGSRSEWQGQVLGEVTGRQLAGQGLAGFGLGRALGAAQGGPVGGHVMLAQVPLVLDHLVAQLALNPLPYSVHVHNVLFQVKRVTECFPAKRTEAGLHAAPPLASGGIWNRAKHGINLGA